MKNCTANASAITSATEVLPLPGGPDNSTRCLGCIPWARSKSALYCSSINCLIDSLTGNGRISSSIGAAGQFRGSYPFLPDYWAARPAAIRLRC